ncbi:hypothetical protein FF38_10280 [Lucilia cuprina]|uniref:Aldehyde dehydrogenase domain-containing protein n=1 Tax=Lucilia cuprina TaxID=7375 RepID=A0A0L0CTD1_LUCCU|nr:hypothetical protein CVS40_2372 [Lucilia cuprina]KNC34659.1 hypothetical protein FF38_10280 [Lucilia cuprina]
MSTALITKELFNEMDFDAPIATKAADTNKGNSSQPTVLIVFANSDINAALYHLNKSLENPFATKAIASVLVQESIKNDFVEKLKQQLKSYPKEAVNNNEHFIKALSTAHKLSAQLISVDQKEANVYAPTLVCDFTHEQLGSTTPSGIVTLHTFRTAKEAIALVNKESLKFSYVSIWHENHSYAYELVTALKSENYFINCYQVPLNGLADNVALGKNYVNLDKSYHYETLQHEGVQKCIVFPIGSIFAN